MKNRWLRVEFVKKSWEEGGNLLEIINLFEHNNVNNLIYPKQNVYGEKSHIEDLPSLIGILGTYDSDLVTLQILYLLTYLLQYS